MCVPDGQACVSFQSCCSQCNNSGFCGPNMCRQDGQNCQLSGQCCSQVCNGNQKCGCTPDGQGSCTGDQDCCSGHCDVIQQKCGCTQDGDTCFQASDCCSGVCNGNSQCGCSMMGDGLLLAGRLLFGRSARTARVPCIALNQFCQHDEDCCSGNCGSNLRCQM